MTTILNRVLMSLDTIDNKRTDREGLHFAGVKAIINEVRGRKKTELDGEEGEERGGGGKRGGRIEGW